MRGRTLFTMTAVGAATLLSSACLSSTSSSSSSDTGAASAPASAAASGSASATTGGAGATVTIWSSIDQPVQDGLLADLQPKAQAAGITVTWKKVEDINKLIFTALDGGSAPDIAFIPQPGVVAQIVAKGKAQPLDSVVDLAALKTSMVPGTLDAGTVNGKLYGYLASMNVKSLVFYPKKVWDAKGYKAPASIPDLDALAAKIKADGTATAPWCMGIESGGATGWPATDWFEDLVMRYGGVQGYNDWVTHKVKFDSPLVRQAAAEFQKVALSPGSVNGGGRAIAATAFGKAGTPMFATPKPGCMLLKQGSFITGFFPDAVKKDLDNQVGLFGFPPATVGGPNPVLGGGDLATLLSAKPEAGQVMKLLTDGGVGVTAATNGSSYLSAHKDFDVTKYKGNLAQSVAKVAYSASTFLFDGSDAMPAKVGSGTFWTDMTKWISGSESLDSALKNIDASWPAS
jgi:alpha-glucoside transport system substrate-binding protein